ncbi:hypothetical protein HDA40_001320 [Hamadaea flava]|uniref:MHC class I antigen n=1 Tax=Hamadaea flava TaxID=1742688 RepID=A0ABV8LS12_9ACTN|nr:hypothetical protein [Hamadaea flava]MCP2322813.1 hypothetical protein [Hamadaea flava]
MWYAALGEGAREGGGYGGTPGEQAAGEDHRSGRRAEFVERTQQFRGSFVH